MFFTGVFLVTGAYLIHSGVAWIWVAVCMVLAAAMLSLALVAPGRLTPLNRAWHALGLLLGRVMNPLVLGLLFFLLITPLALLMRLSGRDALKLRKGGAVSHWVPRSPPGPGGNSFNNQF